MHKHILQGDDAEQKAMDVWLHVRLWLCTITVTSHMYMHMYTQLCVCEYTRGHVYTILRECTIVVYVAMHLNNYNLLL